MAQHMPHHQAIQNAIGMVRDQDQRPLTRYVFKRTANYIQRYAIARHHHVPEVLPVGNVKFITLRAPYEAQTSGNILHSADQSTPTPRVSGISV